jgi:hypothetical protein
MLTSVLVGKSSSQTYGREWRSQRLAEFFRLVVGPFLAASGTGYPPGKDVFRLTLLQFRRPRYGIDFEFYQAERFETDFITPMILFSLYEQFRIYFGYPIRSPDLYKGPGEFERLLGRPADPLSARPSSGGQRQGSTFTAESSLLPLA